MTVGETLTGARNQAGLSVEELSERTQIRGTVIRSIERDDYEACGGDLYVRGYVRAIAGAVGLDAQSLIDEYDLARVAQPYEPGYEPGYGPAGRPALGLPRATPDATRFDLPAVSEDPAATRFDLPPVPAAAADPDATRYDLPPVTDAATTILPAIGPGPASPFPPPPGPFAPPPGRYAPSPAQFAPVPPAGPAGRRRRRTLIGAAAVLVVLAAAGGLGVVLTSGGGSTVISPTANSKPTATAPASAGAGASPTAKASAPGASGQAGNGAAAGSTATTLPVASVTAFGPGGTADGDNAGNAENAVSSSASPWSTQWYATAKFGQLKSGTGLLLSLGGSATVTSVRMELSQDHGATVQVRVGSDTKDLKTAATASDAGGTLQLTLKHPVTGKYLLIWFTQLPPDGSGHYAETVSRVKVQGRR